MLLKDVVEDRVYAMLSWGRDVPHGPMDRWQPRDWEVIGDRAMPVRVIAVGVDVPGYRRKGVRFVRLDRTTLEPAPELMGSRNGVVHEYAHTHAANLMGEWEVLHSAFHDWLDGREEERERRRVELEQAAARRQEQAAKRWMEDQFERARRDIAEVMAVVERHGYEPADVEVQQLVDVRNPDGNPYLNGERTAH